MNKQLRNLIAAGALAGTLGTVAIVPAQAQSSTSATATNPAGTARPDPTTHLRDALKPLVSAGTLTQAQADAVVKALVAARPGPGDRGPGDRGPGGPGGPGRFGPHADTIATVLGTTAADLTTALRSGKTIAQLASDRGVSLQKVIDALVAAEKVEHPQASVSDLTAWVTAMVNGTRPGPGGPAGPGGTDARSRPTTA